MDGGMKANIEADIFDDPEYCVNKDLTEECKHLSFYIGRGFCRITRINLVGKNRVEKSEKCKQAYAKAKQKRDDCFTMPNTQ
jgi:hypothetical protein